MVWQSEKSLWEDEIAKNPKLARPYHNLAWGYYQATWEIRRGLNPLQEGTEAESSYAT